MTSHFAGFWTPSHPRQIIPNPRRPDYRGDTFMFLIILTRHSKAERHSLESCGAHLFFCSTPPTADYIGGAVISQAERTSSRPLPQRIHDPQKTASHAR